MPRAASGRLQLNHVIELSDEKVAVSMPHAASGRLQRCKEDF